MLGEEMLPWSKAVAVEVVKVFRFCIYFKGRAKRVFLEDGFKRKRNVRNIGGAINHLGEGVN